MNPIDFYLCTKEEFMDYFDKHVEFIEGMLKNNPTKGWMPVLTVTAVDPATMKPQMQVYGIDADMDSHEEKFKMMFQLGKMLYGQGLVPTVVVFSSEAWVSKTTEYGMPRNDPNREEKLICMGIDMFGKHTTCATMSMVRDENEFIVPQAFDRMEGMEKAESPLLKQFYLGYFSECKK